MKSKIAYILLLFSLFSCKENKLTPNNNTSNDTIDVNPEEVITINQLSISEDTLVYRIREKGDRDSYDELFYSLMETVEPVSTDSVMFYAKIMAEKYQYGRAYFDYFEALCRKSNIEVNYSDFSSINLLKMDSVTKKQADDWLIKMIKNKKITKQQYDSIKK
ncbi:hypothetical protein [Flavobacterium sp. CLA17]|uniref:hypothetical protein n=1 Tax=Flavobacterium sp. CLA17 TaxID=2724135 RepID=UPI0014910D4B|nr:hypothetical protein [Flavobacterium sp. CLA17]QSB25623.1 hypothetical protein HAV12_014710 [Flavobacterium sp. CLA17]